MKIAHNIDLYNYSTMRTHSIAACMYTPESINELLSLVENNHESFHILGGGSNVVFASYVEKPIINLMELNKKIEINNNKIIAGCSVRIQKLINIGKDHALGGFEYLYSLPASVGGIVYMNAGRGKVHNQQISDWLESVQYLDLSDMKIKIIQIEKEKWTYRHSPFHHMKAIILSATFRMKKTTTEEVMKRIQERINTVKNNQEANKPSCGSVFNKENRYLMRIIRGKRIGGAHYSKKTNNWISNDNNGSADDVIALISYAEKWHKFFGLECVPEIKIFK